MDTPGGTLTQWLNPSSGQPEPELDELAELHRSGVAVAPVMVVPAASQESFYRYGNLVRQLSELFLGVDPEDPDEDDLEERAPAAMALVTGSYLLDEVIDDFYETAVLLPEARRVRRPGEAGLEARGQRASLLAVKRLWAADWSFGALCQRLAATASFALEARPILLHAADVPSSDRTLTAEVARCLGRPARVFVTADGAVSRLV